jgi:hypothetical protein
VEHIASQTLCQQITMAKNAWMNCSPGTSSACGILRIRMGYFEFSRAKITAALLRQGSEK